MVEIEGSSTMGIPTTTDDVEVMVYDDGFVEIQTSGTSTYGSIYLPCHVESALAILRALEGKREELERLAAVRSIR